jgi:hypothetical protein
MYSHIQYARQQMAGLNRDADQENSRTSTVSARTGKM